MSVVRSSGSVARMSVSCLASSVFSSVISRMMFSASEHSGQQSSLVWQQRTTAVCVGWKTPKREEVVL